MWTDGYKINEWMNEWFYFIFEKEIRRKKGEKIIKIIQSCWWIFLNDEDYDDDDLFFCFANWFESEKIK